jgi:hypothetical protein
MQKLLSNAANSRMPPFHLGELFLVHLLVRPRIRSLGVAMRQLTLQSSIPSLFVTGNLLLTTCVEYESVVPNCLMVSG